MTHVDKKGKLILDQDTMCIFLDEFGVHNLPNGHDIFCIGGCVVHSSEMPHLAYDWQRLMNSLFNNPHHTFHASSDQTKSLSKDKHQEVFDFFKNHNLGTFAVGYDKKLELNVLTPYQVLQASLIEGGLRKILTKYPIIKHPLDKILHPNERLYLPYHVLPFREVVLIFEECDRDKDFIQESWHSFGVKLGNICIPVNFCFMPKKSSHACLQIADAISNIGGREMRRRYNNKLDKNQSYDSREIFDSENNKLTYFNHLYKAELLHPAHSS